MKTSKRRTEINNKWRNKNYQKYRASESYSQAKMFVRDFATLERLQNLSNLIHKRELEMKGGNS